MTEQRFSSKLVSNEFKQRILSESADSTEFFLGAYLLRERIIGQRIILDVLFVFLKETESLDFKEETCYSIYKWITERKEDFLIPFFREGYDFSIVLRPHFMDSHEFGELSKEAKDTLESKRIA